MHRNHTVAALHLNNSFRILAELCKAQPGMIEDNDDDRCDDTHNQYNDKTYRTDNTVKNTAQYL